MKNPLKNPTRVWIILTIIWLACDLVLITSSGSMPLGTPMA